MALQVAADALYFGKGLEAVMIRAGREGVPALAYAKIIPGVGNVKKHNPRVADSCCCGSSVFLRYRTARKQETA